MDELFTPVADGKSKAEGLGFSRPTVGGAAWLRSTVLSQRALMAHLGLGW